MTICKQNNKRLAVSIVPSFYCKTNWPYCYLGNLRTNNSGLKQIIKFYKNIKNTTYNPI